MTIRSAADKLKLVGGKLFLCDWIFRIKTGGIGYLQKSSNVYVKYLFYPWTGWFQRLAIHQDGICYDGTRLLRHWSLD